MNWMLATPLIWAAALPRVMPSSVVDPIANVLTSIGGGNTIALGALVTVMVYGLFRGWVVPRYVMEQRIADKDAQIVNLVKERDDWKDAFHLSESGKMEMLKQNGQLIGAGETSTRLMDSMRDFLQRSTQQRQIEGG